MKIVSLLLTVLITSMITYGVASERSFTVVAPHHPPYFIKGNLNNDPQGLIPELWRLIANEMGVTFEFTIYPVKRITPHKEYKKFDIFAVTEILVPTIEDYYCHITEHKIQLSAYALKSEQVEWSELDYAKVLTDSASAFYSQMVLRKENIIIVESDKSVAKMLLNRRAKFAVSLSPKFDKTIEQVIPSKTKIDKKELLSTRGTWCISKKIHNHKALIEQIIKTKKKILKKPEVSAILKKYKTGRRDRE